MKKAIAMILTTVLLAAGVFAGGWFLSKNVYERPDAPVTPITQGGVIDENGKDITQGVHSPKAMTFLAENTAGVTIQANFTPADVEATTIDAAVSFVNPGSEWATGKDPSAYLTATPSTDTPGIVTVVCKEAFGERIKIKIASHDDPSVSTEIPVDYLIRIDTVKNAFKVSDGAADFMVNYNYNSDTGLSTSDTVPFAQGKNYTFAPEFISGVGTKEVAPRATGLTISVSTSFKNYVKKSGVMVDSIPKSVLGLSVEIGTGFYRDMFGTPWNNATNRNIIIRAIREYAAGGGAVFTLKGEYTYYAETAFETTATTSLGFNITDNALKIGIESINTDGELLV